MEIVGNKLTINIPSGMEIDIENSDFVNGIIKFKPTYNNIIETLGINSFTEILIHKDYEDRLQAVAQLQNIAKYYNGNWRPNRENYIESKYEIEYAPVNGYYIAKSKVVNNGAICFKNEKDAIAVINNPNFRDILDEVFKN